MATGCCSFEAFELSVFLAIELRALLVLLGLVYTETQERLHEVKPVGELSALFSKTCACMFPFELKKEEYLLKPLNYFPDFRCY